MRVRTGSDSVPGGRLPSPWRGGMTLTPVAAALCALLTGVTTPARAESGWYNPALLGTGGGTSVDEKALQRLANGQQLPGTYPVDVYVNGNYIAKQDTTLTADGPGGSLTPSWPVNSLLAAGVKPEALAADGKLDISPEAGDHPVPGILNHLAGAQARFDFSRQRLDVTVPELSINRTLSGATDPRFWDEGLNAGIVDYNLSAWKSNARQTGSQDSDSAFLSLNNSINLGAWRAHNFSTWSYNALARNADSLDTTERRVTQRWQAINTWIDRPVPAVKGLLSIGDRYTPSDVFDSVQFRGVQLATDEEMYPDILRNFAPVIRGTATSNARVTVRQNGAVVYETTVPPGPFAITDLPVASLSGDLYVTVREADGTTRTFVQGSSSVAVMQREGQLRYALTGGKLRSSGTDTREPQFLQGTAIWGLPYDLTVYGGLLGADGYQAGSLGLGSMLGVAGALSADVTVAKARIADPLNAGDTTDSTGQSWRLRYSKAVTETGTTLTLAAYRYSTRGYYSFTDANALADRRSVITTFTPDGIVATPVVRGRARQEMQVNLNQSLGDTLGSVGLNATRKTFWDLDSDQESVSANWNWTMKGVGFGLGWQLSRWPGSTQKDDRLVSLMVTLPLSQWLYGPESNHSLYSTTTLTRDNDGRETLSNTVGGTLLEDNRLTLSAGQTAVRAGSDNSGGDSSSANLNASYSGRIAKVTGGYSQTRDTRQVSAGLQGVLVATKYGLTAGQTAGETIALIHAPGAAGIRVKSGTGIETDWWGNAVVAAQPYRRNRYDLDLLTAGQNVTLADTSREVIPTRGAVVAAVYDTTVGHQLLMTLTRGGRPLPFGATVTLARDAGAAPASGSGRAAPGGIVGDAGQAWLTGMPDRGTLNVTWGEGAADTCRVTFVLSDTAVRTAEQQHLPVTTKGECL
ncbi:fimbrial biogenesis outer membrane usher protein [Kosakonia sp. H7A]|nr:fimbrial biogenesis outer membrane usher protein [Kosakonia sp. H7A]